MVTRRGILTGAGLLILAGSVWLTTGRSGSETEFHLVLEEEARFGALPDGLSPVGPSAVRVTTGEDSYFVPVVSEPGSGGAAAEAFVGHAARVTTTLPTSRTDLIPIFSRDVADPPSWKRSDLDFGFSFDHDTARSVGRTGDLELLISDGGPALIDWSDSRRPRRAGMPQALRGLRDATALGDRLVVLTEDGRVLAPLIGRPWEETAPVSLRHYVADHIDIDGSDLFISGRQRAGARSVIRALRLNSHGGIESGEAQLVGVIDGSVYQLHVSDDLLAARVSVADGRMTDSLAYGVRLDASRSPRRVAHLHGGYGLVDVAVCPARGRGVGPDEARALVALADRELWLSPPMGPIHSSAVAATSVGTASSRQTAEHGSSGPDMSSQSGRGTDLEFVGADWTELRVESDVQAVTCTEDLIIVLRRGRTNPLTSLTDAVTGNRGPGIVTALSRQDGRVVSEVSAQHITLLDAHGQHVFGATSAGVLHVFEDSMTALRHVGSAEAIAVKPRSFQTSPRVEPEYEEASRGHDVVGLSALGARVAIVLQEHGKGQTRAALFDVRDPANPAQVSSPSTICNGGAVQLTSDSPDSRLVAACRDAGLIQYRLVAGTPDPPVMTPTPSPPPPPPGNPTPGPAAPVRAMPPSAVRLSGPTGQSTSFSTIEFSGPISISIEDDWYVGDLWAGPQEEDWPVRMRRSESAPDAGCDRFPTPNEVLGWIRPLIGSPQLSDQDGSDSRRPSSQMAWTGTMGAAMTDPRTIRLLVSRRDHIHHPSGSGSDTAEYLIEGVPLENKGAWEIVIWAYDGCAWSYVRNRLEVW